MHLCDELITPVCSADDKLEEARFAHTVLTVPDAQ